MPDAGSRSLGSFGNLFGQRFGEPNASEFSVLSKVRRKRVVISGVVLPASDPDAGDDPENVGNWDLLPVSASAVPASIDSVTREDDGIVLETSDFSDGETYRLTVVGDLKFADGASLRGDGVDFVAVGDRPEVVEVRPIGKKLIRVTFSEDVREDADLVDTSSYAFSGVSTLTPIAVTVTSPTTVEVEVLEEMTEDGLYDLTV